MTLTAGAAITRQTRSQTGACPRTHAGRARLGGSLLVLLAAGASQAQEYAIQVLTPLPGFADSFALGINDAGVVVGTSRLPGGGRATRWVDGVPQDLGMLPGWEWAIPFDVSSDGTRIVGEVRKAGVWVPFIWENGALLELPAPTGATVAGGWQINDSGVIAGRAVTPQGLRACRWDKLNNVWTLTVLTSLTGLPNAGAWGVNQAGHIAGASLTGGNWSTARATRWVGGVPGVPSGLENVAATITGLNDLGQAVGDREVTPGGAWHATYYDGQSLTDLGTIVYLNSYAHRINNRGTIIGQSYGGTDPTELPRDDKRAFIRRAGTMAAVNDLIAPGQGWDVKQLWDLSDSDQAVGYGRHNGLWRGCLLTPICYPDCDTTTGRGTLDIFDFLCFQNRFAAAEPYACDCDTSTGAGVCDIFDFLCFQNAYDAGCE